MANCEDIERLIAPYVDGGIDEREKERVAAHLGACAPCRNTAGREAAARQVLHARAKALVPRASTDLRARCARTAGAPSSLAWVGRGASAWRRAAVPLAAAASLLLGVAAIYATRATTASLAAQLTLDHVKCFTLFSEPVTRVDPETVSRSLESAYGLRVDVPAGLDEEGLRLLGARRCLTADGRVAHVLYRHDGHNVSLFVIPGYEWKAGARSLMGHETIVWSANGNGYAVVGAQPAGELRRAAYLLQRKLR
ncbi:MAG: zf-HC2 domain-containing protein [Vicinamibacterales bacterium]